MDDIVKIIPRNYNEILQKSEEVGFTMSSDLYIGALLKILVASKPSGNFLELGTGLGLSLSWISDGMDETSKVISVDNDSKLTDLVTGFFQNNKNVFIFCADGGEWIEKYEGEKFDLIFADAWPGKFERLKETLDLLKIGGFYVIDDLEPQPNWPEAHQQKVEDLLKTLEARIDLVLTKVNWSTGLILATKK